MSAPRPDLRAFFLALATATADPSNEATYEAARETARLALATADDQAATMRRAFRAVFQERP